MRKLVEVDQVLLLFSTIGTPSNTAIQGYLNDNKVLQVFIASGADKRNDPKHYPWTIGWLPSYRLEARIYAHYILKNLPDAKIAVLYQNDDFGKDYLIGLRESLGDKADKMIVAKQTYETTDPTVDSQVVALQGSGASVLLTAATPKFAAQAIRKIYDIGWKPTHFLAYVSSSVGSVMRPAGPEKGVGIISATCLKDPTDPQWQDTPEYSEWLARLLHHILTGEIVAACLKHGDHGLGTRVTVDSEDVRDIGPQIDCWPKGPCSSVTCSGPRVSTLRGIETGCRPSTSTRSTRTRSARNAGRNAASALLLLKNTCVMLGYLANKAGILL